MPQDFVAYPILLMATSHTSYMKFTGHFFPKGLDGKQD